MKQDLDEDFIERKYWGLDPLFDCYVTLFVCDILQLQKYPTGDGAYAYKNHPVHRVDIFGMVVRLDEREKYYRVDVDDGTGVISCTCWKQHGHQSCRNGNDTEYKHLFASLKNLTIRAQESKKIQLGDMLHVRGDIGEFRERREVSAPYYRVEQDLNMEARRIKSAVYRYKTVYDVPFVLHRDDRGGAWARQSGLEPEARIVTDLKASLTMRLMIMKMESFTISGLMGVAELLVIAEHPCQDCNEKLNGNITQAIPPVKHHFQCAIQLLIEEAVCYLSSEGENFVVVQCSKTLAKAVMAILSKIRNHEGTHYLKVHSHLQKLSEFKNVSAYMVKKCLEKLEEQSLAVGVTKAKFVIV
ncbi:CST complex subunit STN1-like [Lineus longissimus]|uniref:CST complex subunit STN1-like n=1 Tax=Lineus longissimus TaxID=88925 RepID=UPI002B4DE4E0